MQNKKSLLQRLLVIYITFFIVLVASIAHGILPNFSRGAAEGAELGNDIAEKWKSGVPRMIYMLGDIRVTGQPETAVEIAAAPGVEIKANVRKLALVVEQNFGRAERAGGVDLEELGGVRDAAALDVLKQHLSVDEDVSDLLALEQFGFLLGEIAVDGGHGFRLKLGLEKGEGDLVLVVRENRGRHARLADGCGRILEVRERDGRKERDSLEFAVREEVDLPQSLWPANSTFPRQSICRPRCEQSKTPFCALIVSTGWL